MRPYHPGRRVGTEGSRRGKCVCSPHINVIPQHTNRHPIRALTHDQKINIEFNIELLFALRSQDEDDTSALVKIACDAALSFADLHNAGENRYVRK